MENNISKDFYLLCKKEGITKHETKADIARILLVAENNEISDTEENLIKRYDDGKKAFEQEQKEKREIENDNEIAYLRTEEIEYIEKAKKISQYNGREKTISKYEEEIVILKRQITEHTEKYKDLQKKSNEVYNAGVKKEKDWAIHGGIASGLAGGAAGLATALDIQRQNAEAKVHNQELLKFTVNAQTAIGQKYYAEIAPIERKINELQAKIENYKKKLIEHLNKFDLLLKMNPQVLKQEITGTGAIRLTVQIDAVADLKIYDSVNAIVDGSFKVFLLDGDSVAGEVYFALPFGGVNKQETIDGYFVDGQDVNKRYNTIFVPVNLWAIESEECIQPTQSSTKFCADENIELYNYVARLTAIDQLTADDYKNLTAFIENHSYLKEKKELKEKCLEEFKCKQGIQSKLKKKNESYAIKSMQTYISAGNMRTVAARNDGTIITVGVEKYGENNISTWTDIIAVSTGDSHVVGLKADGKVVATLFHNNLEYDYGQCNVSDWNNIVAISAARFHTVGLKSDGTVISTKFKDSSKDDCGQCNVSGWKDIVAISAEMFHTVGLKADGTVVATQFVGGSKYDYGQCNVLDWKDIVAISASVRHTVGLKSDGTVVATGYTGELRFYDGRCDVSGWKDIVAVSAGGRHTVGLKSDGTVVAIGDNDDGQCDVQNWNNIVAISAGWTHTVGLKSDGTVVATGYDSRNVSKVLSLNNIAMPVVAETREEILAKREEMKVNRKSGLCQHCGGSFKGIFSKVCVQCGKKKDY